MIVLDDLPMNVRLTAYDLGHPISGDEARRIADEIRGKPGNLVDLVREALAVAA